LGDRAVVRSGSDISTPVRGRLPFDACLTFDLRLPDNSWVRIAPEQPDEANVPFALGWVKSELLSEADAIPHLNPYLGDSATAGIFCVNTGVGINVRACAGTTCQPSGTLNWKECLRFDGRLADSSWLRIAREQDDERYFGLAGMWVSTADFSLVLGEFQSYIEAHDMTPYFEQLPVVNS
jgi:hypothetical protein